MPFVLSTQKHFNIYRVIIVEAEEGEKRKV